MSVGGSLLRNRNRSNLLRHRRHGSLLHKVLYKKPTLKKKRTTHHSAAHRKRHQIRRDLIKDARRKTTRA